MLHLTFKRKLLHYQRQRVSIIHLSSCAILSLTIHTLFYDPFTVVVEGIVDYRDGHDLPPGCNCHIYNGRSDSDQ